MKKNTNMLTDKNSVRVHSTKSNAWPNSEPLI